ncbi:hypothetical protein ADL35_18655, partial [Streptomyces sp. NRRL WC-3753]
MTASSARARRAFALPMGLAVASSLVLVPVELRRDRTRRSRLHLPGDQERIHNPALAVKLDRLGVD